MDLQLYIFLLLNFAYALHSMELKRCWQMPLFSTKSPYKLVVAKNEDINLQKPLGNCVPIHVNMVHRHGNRYPSSKDTHSMQSMADKINQAVGKVSPEISLHLPWKCPFSVAQNKLLSNVGEDELYGIGKNLQSKFPELFMNKYSPLLYSFQSTCKLRCTHSSNALALGIFEDLGTTGKYKSQPIAIKTAACDNDPILRFFEICKKYVVDVEESKSSSIEMKKFSNGPEIQRVTKKVMDRLGIPDINLDATDLKAILIACSYDLGMFNGTSGICSLFDDEDLSVVEYLLDLKHFYKRSTAFKITYESSCPLLKDILETLKLAATNSSESYIGIFRSAHAETIIPLYGLLGLYIDDEKLTATNFRKMRNRRFKAACLSPFSGNLYFILYNCGSDGYKVQLYVNEQLTRLPCCDSAVECSFETFLKYYDRDVSECHFKQMCKLFDKEL